MRLDKLQSLKRDEILGEFMGEDSVCDYPGCGEVGEIVSRLSPEGYLVATGKKAYSFREAYRRFYYCASCHDKVMGMLPLLPFNRLWRITLIHILT